MKKICFTSALLFACCASFAQDNANDAIGERKMIDRVTGNLLYVYQYEDVKGSSFLSDNWLPGTVILNTNVAFKNVKLKFDVANNEFVFNRNDSSFQLGPEAVEVILYQKNGDSLIFKNGYEINNAILASKYLQVLT